MATELRPYILDSYALLAYLGGEPGCRRVQSVLSEAEQQGQRRALVSIINLGEVLYITERELGFSRAQAALAVLDDLPLQVLPASREAVLAAAHVKANHRLSYADAFAVAAAQEADGIILTGDPEFEEVEGMVEVEWMLERES